MKLVMDEKLKHRLVGISVILSLGAIFFPAMMKKSSQRLESNFSVKVQLPPKPVAPHVVVTDEEQMFKTIKVAKAHILPSQTQASSQSKLDQKESIALASIKSQIVSSIKTEASKAIEKPKELALLNEAAQKAAQNSVNLAKPVQAAAITVARTNLVTQADPTTIVKKGVYAVQLASFAQLTNAQALVKKLEQQGYKANYTRVAGKKGAIYKVFTGYSSDRDNVMKLKTYLASTMRLNGFVVKTGVS
jgi:DedD protein